MRPDFPRPIYLVQWRKHGDHLNEGERPTAFVISHNLKRRVERVSGRSDEARETSGLRTWSPVNRLNFGAGCYPNTTRPKTEQLHAILRAIREENNNRCIRRRLFRVAVTPRIAFGAHPAFGIWFGRPDRSPWQSGQT
jgi:hypothetical protein